MECDEVVDLKLLIQLFHGHIEASVDNEIRILFAQFQVSTVDDVAEGRGISAKVLDLLYVFGPGSRVNFLVNECFHTVNVEH